MGAFIEALTSAIERNGPTVHGDARIRESLGTRLVRRLRSRSEGVSKLRVLEKVRITPRQGLFLIDAEGERLLVATSDGSTSAIFPLSRAGEIRIEGSCA